jgi:hypothetical protein
LITRFKEVVQQLDSEKKELLEQNEKLRWQLH